MHYIVVLTIKDLKKFQEDVNQKIKEGYRPIGGVAVDWSDNQLACFQAKWLYCEY